MTTLADFIRLWTHPDYPPDRVAEADMRRAEQRFGIVFPAAYRQAVLAHGAPAPTLALLNSIVENEIDIEDVSEFFVPDDVISATEDWRGMGLPGTLVAFAGDSMGNLFAFDQGGAPSVWFFNHDSGDVRRVADSFEDWLARYCALPPAAID
ncbi:MAG: SMI1/KNR4 family protein [Brevundimonas sp.]|nr:SMI1/KNR4 family protein [Brevundimonas sp.]